VKYKRAFVKVVAFFYLHGPYSFPHRRNPQGHAVFNEVAPIYPRAAIKASLPKKLCDYRVKIAKRLAPHSTGALTPGSKAMSGGALSCPSLIG
jgi:hypothetical protein